MVISKYINENNLSFHEIHIRKLLEYLKILSRVTLVEQAWLTYLMLQITRCLEMSFTTTEYA